MSGILGNMLLTCPYESENVYKIINKKLIQNIGDFNLTCKSFITNSSLIKDSINNFKNLHKGKVPNNTDVEVFCNGSQVLLIKLNDIMYITDVEVFCNGSQVLLIKLNDIMYIHNKWIDMLPR